MPELSLAARPYRQMARNNRLANLRLLTACGALLPGELEATRVSFFPSLLETLNHLLVVDLFYIDALEGGVLGYAAFDDPRPCPDILALMAAQQRLDERLLALCDGLTAENLADEVRIIRGGGRVQIELRADVLLHLFMHQTHHRGQVHAMLAGTSIKPPQLDEFIVQDDARFRMVELMALGWSEKDMAR